MKKYNFGIILLLTALGMFVVFQLPSFSSESSDTPNKINIFACDEYGQQLLTLYDEKYPFDESDPNYKDYLNKEQDLREKIYENCGSVHP